MQNGTKGIRLYCCTYEWWVGISHRASSNLMSVFFSISPESMDMHFLSRLFELVGVTIAMVRVSQVCEMDVPSLFIKGPGQFIFVIY